MENNPGGWLCHTKIKDVCLIRAGNGFPLKYQDRVSGTIGFYKVGDISRNWQAGRISLTKAKHYLSKNEAKEIRAQTFPSGTVVFAKIGAAVALNRRAILIAESLIDNNVMGLIPGSGIDSRYLFYFMCQVDLGVLTRGGNVPSLRNGDVEKIKFPLPPLAEQRRIVAKIEELFSELDQGIETLKQARAQLAVYRQALLKHAFEGNLTAAWRAAHADELESGKELLACRKGEGAGFEPIATNDTQSLPTLPEGWIYGRLGAFVDSMSAGKSFSCEERRPRQDEVGVAKVSAVTWGEYQEAESKTCVDMTKVNPAFYIKKGDFLLSRANTIDLVGSCVIARKVTQRIMLSDKTLRLGIQGLPQEYLLHYLRSRQGRKEIMAKSTGNQESMRNIGQDRIRSIIIPVCSVKEATKIASLLETHLTAIDAGEDDIDLNLQKAEALRQSILKKAFAGELVPQDPADEPASELLARIRAEREAAVTSPRMARKVPRKTQRR